ncbi:PAS domain S-box protein [Geothrix sp. PMB-07]|uniref:PAS domain-containing sensor histidine kinase n=1 Tax=Geothrix sp. PMB-07 TaxID=3068640 RepID=UPI00274126E3|nr:PAS domain S-box protein [Geothrix sp. PMB-07]WLT32294.1 PAS domain S-box protein [Geothrix sp. PMB-07]
MSAAPPSAPLPAPSTGGHPAAPSSLDPNSRALIRSLLIVAAIITGTELTIMVTLEPLFGENQLVMAFVDSGTLILVCFPCLYYLLVKPMVRHLVTKAETERHLKEMEATNEFLKYDAKVRTEAELAERTKADSRIQFQAGLLAVVQQAVIATGKGGVILYWNQFAELLFGWTEQEVQNQTLAMATGFSVESAAYGLSGPVAAKGWSGEVRAVRRDGTRFPAFLTASTIRRNDDSIAGFVYTFIDISARKQTEAAIRESEEKYSTVVESSPTGIFIYREGRLVFGNQRFFQMIGSSPFDLARLEVTSLIHPDDWPAVQELWRLRLAGKGTAQDYECRMLTPQGEVRWISGRTTLIQYGGAPSLLGNIQDITEKHLAEAALRESRETLQRVSARLMSAQEGERQRVARELHDSLGQSLSAAKFIVERALDEEGSEQQGKSLRAVVPILQNSVEEVRRISMALRPSTLDDLGLLATIAWFTREFQNTYPHFEVERVVDIEEFEVPDELRTSVFRIIQEAMNNSAKYSQGTRITVGLRLVMGELQVVIADDGIGFDPKNVKRSHSGSGYGLASMRERAELFGGSMIVTSTPGQGTMIMARWPVDEDATS